MKVTCLKCDTCAQKLYVTVDADGGGDGGDSGDGGGDGDGGDGIKGLRA